MRKATNARIVTRVPIFETISTQFGPVKQKTNRFKEIRRYPNSHIDRKMTDKEKSIRKQIKQLKGDKSAAYEVAQLRLELNKILNPPIEA